MSITVEVREYVYNLIKFLIPIIHWKNFFVNLKRELFENLRTN